MVAEAEALDPDPAPLRREAVRATLKGQLVLAPLTKGGNLPYRRLCVEMGARVTFSEMAVSRQVIKGFRQELVLLRSHESEACFGVQLAARKPEEAAAAARIAVERGARFVDLNSGCPIHHFCSKGMGAALLTKPRRLEAILRAMRAAVDVPIFVKIRSGYQKDRINALEIARGCEEAGADALTLHARTREQRYRRPADWDLIAEVATALSIPVIGNGDILHASEALRRLEETEVSAVMAARGALIQPWIFQDFVEGRDRARSGEERLAIARRYVELALDTWGADEIGYLRTRGFLEFHVDFWSRYVPPGRELDAENTMQARASFEPADEIEEILLAPDAAGLDRACGLILAGFDAPDSALRPSPHAPDPSAGGWS